MRGNEHESKAIEDFLYICRYGSKTATYKFALAMSLLDLKDFNKPIVTLDELAPLFVSNLIRHISRGKKQFNNKTGSAVIRHIYRHMEGSLGYDEMIEFVKKKWYKDVLYRFHNLKSDTDITQFYIIDGSGSRNISIELTEAMQSILNSVTFNALRDDVESMWNKQEDEWGNHSLELKVQKSDSLNVSRPSHKTCLSSMSRKTLRHLGHSLNLDNNNECFYCSRYIDVEGTTNDKELRWAVDHFLPHTLLSYNPDLPIEQPFNYVLACKQCNSSKGMKTPPRFFLSKLIVRNERLIEIGSKFREGIIEICGGTYAYRESFSNIFYEDCKQRNGAETWIPSYQIDTIVGDFKQLSLLS